MTYFQCVLTISFGSFGSFGSDVVAMSPAVLGAGAAIAAVRNSELCADDGCKVGVGGLALM